MFDSLQNFLGFGQSAEIDIVFNDSENRKYAECRMDESGKKEKLLLYYDGESISGKVGDVSSLLETPADPKLRNCDIRPQSPLA